MSSAVLCAIFFLACASTLSAAQTLCKGRCGAEYYRGSLCQCDYSCLTYGECCKDYESQCTTKNSCKGRCGETFKRGRRCSCDSDCMKFKQCCSDYKTHCDAEEEIIGAASATAPEKTYSCHNVNNDKPKEPALNEATESEGNNAGDHVIPLDSPTAYPQDDLGDDMYSQIFPNDDFSNNGVNDLEASPIPESTSGYGSATADLLDQISTEPTPDPDYLEFSTETVTVFAQTEMTHSDNETLDSDGPSTPYGTEEAPTESTAAVSSQTTPTSETQTESSPAANSQELVTQGQEDVLPDDDFSPDAQDTEPTEASTGMPEAQTTGPTQDTPTVLETTQVTTMPTSSTPEPTPVPEANLGQDANDVTMDPSISVSPAGTENLDFDAMTTNIPTLTNAAQDDTADDVAPEVTTADLLDVTPNPTEPTSSEATSKPQDKPEPYKPVPAKPTVAKPSSKPETKPVDPVQTLNVDDPRDYQADDSNDTNLCSGRPVSAVTTLRNGTIVVFRGHYFWLLDRNRVPGPARDITQVWGVPSPIDTVFSRCNCQGKTYIFKGAKYWRFENDALDTGYPKLIETGFDGLRGHITAALSVPQYQRRRESVYFFKRGGLVQQYSYQFGTSPTCGRKVQHSIYTVRNRIARQAVSILGPAISIRKAWVGFPSTITAAVSIPSNREPEGYRYYVFSRSKSYNVRMDSERPVIAAPAANTSPQSSNFFNCPQTV